ncbi:glycosyltransferase family 9 protein [Herbaspirillum robiniae]|uniref:Glycosyltransferase family 9 protein n=1 Tax=Herbaspirillum robiniae TaxID=2014887 RepID=A0ABX2LTS9_9BURK|nr:glycosyltransferase family 9 protein [Herbaspirillum robiniae]NUU01937.1 glycosyltransferase family 9 protein [Herbaspirillum robiniae]
MADQLVPAELLEKSDKILFVAHLALGDFTYMQNCFRAFADAYPHIRMHLWVDEVRRTSDPSQWKHLSQYALYDWVKSCGLFDKIFDKTYSPVLYQQSIAEAQREEYPVVVSFAVLRRHLYAELARKISPRGFVVAQKKRVRLLDIRKHLAYRKLDAHIPAYSSKDIDGRHISDIYAGWFEQLFGISIPEPGRFPYVDVPDEWDRKARDMLQKWGVPEDGKLVFLNAYSKSEERSWPLDRMLQLARRMRELPQWKDAHFIFNCVPEKMTEARRLFDDGADGMHLFSADENFFQLPALLSKCTLIVSVETAVMHLANAVKVPVIALMRQTSPEWVPVDASRTHVLTVRNRKDWLNEMKVDEVFNFISEHFSR